MHFSQKIQRTFSTIFSCYITVGPHTVALYPDAFRLGTTGKDLPGVKTRIDEPDKDGNGEVNKLNLTPFYISHSKGFHLSLGHFETESVLDSCHNGLGPEIHTCIRMYSQCIKPRLVPGLYYTDTNRFVSFKFQMSHTKKHDCFGTWRHLSYQLKPMWDMFHKKLPDETQ